jgi:hypothetical protein
VDLAARWAPPVTLILFGSLALAGVSDAEDPSSVPIALNALAIVGFAACLVGAGALLASPSALLLALVPILVAIPFGFPDDPDIYEPIPLWFAAIMGTPVTAWLLGIGALAGAWRWRALAYVLLVTLGVVGGLAFANGQGWT